MEKINMRKDVLDKRNRLPLEKRKKYNELILESLISSDSYKNAKNIFIYISFGSEVDTKDIIKHAIKDNKEVYVPKTDKEKKEMIAVKINSLDNMIVDKWGILEPRIVDKVEENFDLIIMPGAAFDLEGNRIGYGGGYYDKYISKHKNNGILVALAYNFQIVPNIPYEEHDIKVNSIITEEKIVII